MSIRERYTTTASVSHQHHEGTRALNAFTVDVEDYFHMPAVYAAQKAGIAVELKSRVVEETLRLLDSLDAAGVKATLFFLGLVAEKHPYLVREAHNRGHELACHGFDHIELYDLSPNEFRQTTRRAKSAIEDAAGVAVNGYRAAVFSITEKSFWALQVLAEIGFKYDSSIYPVWHDRYGVPSAPVKPFRIHCGNGLTILEFPLATVRFGPFSIPFGGGGYFRLYPWWLMRQGLHYMVRQNIPICFYFHPWELDADQPRLQILKGLARFRHYYNLDKTGGRLSQLFSEFEFGPAYKVLRCWQFSEVDEFAIQHEKLIPVFREAAATY